jgi:hypothetical protein
LVSGTASLASVEPKTEVIGEAVAQRLENDEASRLRALGAAIMIGFAVGVAAYRLLRGRS